MVLMISNQLDVALQKSLAQLQRLTVVLKVHHGTLKLEHVFHPAHVKDVATSTAVMNQTTSYTRHTQITTKQPMTTTISKNSTKNGMKTSTHGGSVESEEF